MKVKFLVPDINTKQFAKDFSWLLHCLKLELKSLSNIGTEENSESLVFQYKKNKKFPSINRFLSICSFFHSSPDSFLSAKPNWIECEVDDISKFSVYGKIGDTYYVIPNNDGPYQNRENHELTEEPDIEFFTGFHFYKDTDKNQEKNEEGKYIYRFPSINDNKTADLIENILAEYKLTIKQLSTLLKYKQPVSIYSRFKRTKPWTLDNIYKLSWILNKPIQDLIVVENQEETCESHFEPVFFLEHYPICYDRRIEMENVYQRLSKKFKKK